MKTVAVKNDAPLEPAQIRARQEKAFLAMIRLVFQSNEFYRSKLIDAGFRSDTPTGPSDLVRFPLTTLRELQDDREAHPPFGSNLTHPPSRYTRLHHGWLDTPESWSWWLDCWDEIYRAAGVSPGDRVFVARSATGGIATPVAIEAGQRLGALTVTAEGTAGGDAVETMRACEANVVVASAEDAGRLLAGIEDRSGEIVCPERWIVHAAEIDGDVEAVAALAESAAGARCHPVALGHEAGAWAFGCGAGALHVNEAEFIAEIVDPRSGERVPAGDDRLQRGELVLTNLGRVGSPAIRLATGRIVELSGEDCACGRHFRSMVTGHARSNAMESPGAAVAEPDRQAG